MEKEFGMVNGNTREKSHAARPVTAPPAVGAGRLAVPEASGPGFELRNADGDSLNLLLTNRLLSALPTEEFSRLFPHLEPVSLAAGEMLYRLDQEMRYAYFPETAVVSHLYIMSEGGMTEADMVGREGMTGLSAVFNVPPPSYMSEVT